MVEKSEARRASFWDVDRCMMEWSTGLSGAEHKRTKQNRTPFGES